MHPRTQACTLAISSPSHDLRTVTVRDDLVGWVQSGRKRLFTPGGSLSFTAGRVFMLPRLSQWDLQNEAPPGGRYRALVLSFPPDQIGRFHAQHGQFVTLPAIQGSAGTDADSILSASLSHAWMALQDPNTSPALREHRTMEVLLVLAERGLRFAEPQALGWAERVRRLIEQRPQEDWTLERVAQAFHQSGSTLQRRLAEESVHFSQCLREVRLETALALLQSQSLPIAEVAARCGYGSHSRFTAAFRERYGFLPSHLQA